MGDVNDPFYLVKEEIQLSVDKAKAVTERMDRLPEHNGERARYATKSSPSATALFGSWRS